MVRYMLFVLVFLSCSERVLEDIDARDTGRDYFPINVNKVLTFDLDSIIYDPEPGGTKIDTLSYEMQWVIVDTLSIMDGDTLYQLDRFLRKSSSDAWQIRDVWTVKMSARNMVWTEGNLPFVKLSFPIEDHQRWDGNALFDDDEVRIKVRGEVLDVFKFWGNYVGEKTGSQTINDIDYEEVWTVTQVDKEINIEKRFSQEKYARGVGLVYQRMEILDTQNENVAIPMEKRAERGYIVEIRRK